MWKVGLGKGGRHCAVNNCSNGDYGIKKWAKAVCTIHGCHQGGDDCNWHPPYELHNFPTRSIKPTMVAKEIVKSLLDSLY